MALGLVEIWGFAKKSVDVWPMYVLLINIGLWYTLKKNVESSLMSFISFTFTEANTEVSYWHLFSLSTNILLVTIISRSDYLVIWTKAIKNWGFTLLKIPPIFICCSVANLDFDVIWCNKWSDFLPMRSALPVNDLRSDYKYRHE